MSGVISKTRRRLLNESDRMRKEHLALIGVGTPIAIAIYYKGFSVLFALAIMLGGVAAFFFFLWSVETVFRLVDEWFSE